MSGEVQSLDGREVIWEALPRQDVALRCPAFEVGYGGAKGGGKSDAVVMCPERQIRYAHAQWKATGRKQRGRWVIFRKNLENLTDIKRRTLEIYPALDRTMGERGWKENRNRWEFTSGYVVQVAHLDGPTDHLGYQGQELTGFSIDQAEDISEDVYDFLKMQVRSRDDGMRKLLKIFLTFNPGGPHGAWLKRRFYDGCKPHNTIISREIKTSVGVKVTTSAFVPAFLYDNKYLHASGEYEANIRTLPEHLQRMYLDGDWDVVVGAMFESLWRREIHAINSFPISGAWTLKMGIDWGTTKPACCLVGAQDHDGNVYIIDELYKPGVTGKTFGEDMLGLFSRQKWSADRKWLPGDLYALFDWSARNPHGADGDYANAAAGISSKGFRLFDANKARKAGIEQLRERLLLNAKGKPSLYVFKDRCPNLVRTLPQLMADPKDPEDIDTTGEDHCLVGDTVVHTTTGPATIESLAGKSGVAYGANGEPVDFWNVRLTKRDAEVVKVIASDGRSVTCTPDHRIMTDNGWVEAGKLSVGDVLHSVTLSEWTLSSSLKQFKNTPGSAGTSAASTSSARENAYTDACGQMRMDQSQLASMYTTQMTTGQTTDWGTLSAYQAANMLGIMDGGSLQQADVHRLGMRANLYQQETPACLVNSEAWRQQMGGHALNAIPSSAAYAEQLSSLHSQAGLSFAAEPVAPRTCVAAVEPAGRADVFDLSVDTEDHAFAVNGGLVVHNCYDALRYMLMDWPVSTVRTKDTTGDKDADVQRWLDIARRRQQTNETDSTFTTGYGD